MYFSRPAVKYERNTTLDLLPAGRKGFGCKRVFLGPEVDPAEKTENELMKSKSIILLALS